MPQYDDEHDEVYYSDEEEAFFDLILNIRYYLSICEEENEEPDIDGFIENYNVFNLDEKAFWNEVDRWENNIK